MLESKLADDFMDIFTIWAPVVCVNHSIPGWPDRMLQERNTSRICFAELKVCTVSDDITLELRPDQSAWLYKWQRHGGKCFLFIGMCNKIGRMEYYGVYSVTDYKDWLLVSRDKIPISKIKLLIDDKQVKRWFTNYMKMDT